ncbi:MAG: S-methyl-5-thioribose-1-phosphate isomerase [Gemmatimonadetes bacterium]|nr:S-methyl-5-thioribose-1-phosphate isomerase [Gemmatimonadota bacterium]
MRAVDWAPGRTALRIIDQRLLPVTFERRDLTTADEIREAIATLAVRGAPAIGVAAAIGLAVVARHAAAAKDVGTGREAFVAAWNTAADLIAAARPTAVNLAWAVGRMRTAAARTPGSAAAVATALEAEADAVLSEDREMCAAIGNHGLGFVPDGARVLTHCNAGALATAGIGTALAPVYAAHAAGRRVSVIAGETRPLLQGGRLTAWELTRAGVPVRLVTDGMSASLMRTGEVDVVLVGADRIAANGDVVNKIGTYAVAVAARHHGIPFVVCAPSSTIDSCTPTGAGIPIEHRAADEVAAASRADSAQVAVWNPAFDLTPAALVTAIVTDRGVWAPPYSFAS